MKMTLTPELKQRPASLFALCQLLILTQCLTQFLVSAEVQAGGGHSKPGLDHPVPSHPSQVSPPRPAPPSVNSAARVSEAREGGWAVPVVQQAAGVEQQQGLVHRPQASPYFYLSNGGTVTRFLRSHLRVQWSGAPNYFSAILEHLERQEAGQGGVFAADEGSSPEHPLYLNLDHSKVAGYLYLLFELGRVSIPKKAHFDNLTAYLDSKCLVYQATSPNFKVPAPEIARSYVIKMSPGIATASLQVEGPVDGSEAQTSVCPKNFILVPGSQDFFTSERGDDFCIGKFAASKAVSSRDAKRWVAATRTRSLPWLGASLEEAQSACGENGPGFHLVTLNEWALAARTIEAEPRNWNQGEGPQGVGHLSRGNFDTRKALPVFDDRSPYSGLRLSVSDWIHRRTHLLAGEAIWDMGGNVYQLVDAEELDAFGLAKALVPPANGYRFIYYDSLAWESNSFFLSQPQMKSLFSSLTAEVGNAKNLGRMIFVASQESLEQSQDFQILRGGGSLGSTDLSRGLFNAVLVPPHRIRHGFRCAYSPTLP